MADETPTTPDPAKPGHKTTEFYLHLAVVILGALSTLASTILSVKRGEVDPGTAITGSLGLIMSTLSACGYSTSRAIVKSSAVLLLVLALAGCSSAPKENVALVLEARDLLLDPVTGDVIDADWQARRFVFLSDSAPIDTRGRSQ